jgi:metal-responsive CopG/Arc/MetJ family transcriptional regulator
MKSVKIDSDLFQRVSEHAQKEGYSSTEEFVVHVLEKALAQPLAVEEDEREVERRLQGLGYLE